MDWDTTKLRIRGLGLLYCTFVVLLNRVKMRKKSMLEDFLKWSGLQDHDHRKT